MITEMSRPVRGAWIETSKAIVLDYTADGRAPCGARGLKPYASREVLMAGLVAPRTGRVD